MKRLFMYLLLIFSAHQVVAAQATAPDLSDQRVLLLHSYHPTFPTAAKVLDGMASVFGPDGPVLNIEYMDTKRLNDAQSQANFLTSLRYKLSRRESYDLVIAAEDNALDFALSHGTELFPHVPVVFLGVNDLEKAAALNGNPNVTGIVEAASFEESLHLMARILPERKRLTVVVDGTRSGTADRATLLSMEDKLDYESLSFLSLETLRWDELARQLTLLGDKDDLLLLSAYSDRDGQSRSFSDSLSLIAANTVVPIFHLWEHGIGQGVFGGVVVSHFEQGRQAAAFARRVLQGEPPANIPVLMQSPNVPMFDYAQLKRFNIAESALPEETVMVGQSVSNWYLYRIEIYFSLALLAVMLFVSIYLARQNMLLGRLTNELHEKTSFVRRLMDTIPDLVWMKDVSGVYLSCNKRVEELLGKSEAEIVGKSDPDLMDKDLAETFQKFDQEALRSGQSSKNEEWVCFHSDGQAKLLETIKTRVSGDHGEPLGVVGVARDITVRRQHEEKIRILSQAIEQSPVSVMVTDADMRIEYINEAFLTGTGFSREEVLGETPRLLRSSHTPESTYESLRAKLAAGERWEGEFLNKKKNGELFWEYAHVAPVFQEDNSLRGYLAIKEDITLRKKQQQKIMHQAQFDALTGLPNRLLSFDRLQQLILEARRGQEQAAVLFIDLDDFKKINDTLGHDVGDELLIQVASRLREETREMDTVGRLGGDEFLLLLKGIANTEDAGHVAGHLISELERPFVVQGRELLLSASIGISMYPADGTAPRDLLRKADTAMYSAKREGRAAYEFFSSRLNDRVSRRFQLEEQLRGALARNEFRLVYQPQVDLSSRKMVGVEALLRWRNETLGEVSPAEFIPIAERSGLIVPIGQFVIETALRETRDWLRDVRNPFLLAINLSPRQFRDDQLGDFLMSSLENFDIAPDRLEVEITEGLFLEQRDGVSRCLKRMSQHGIRLAIDDFGTGYSSLSCLRRHPFDTIKIDKEFVQGIALDESDYELVFAVISMAHGLGLNVVAEGVENRDQHELLEYHGCDVAQGFLYARPVAAKELKRSVDRLPAVFREITHDPICQATH